MAHYLAVPLAERAVTLTGLSEIASIWLTAEGPWRFLTSSLNGKSSSGATFLNPGFPGGSHLWECGEIHTMIEAGLSSDSHLSTRSAAPATVQRDTALLHFRKQ